MRAASLFTKADLSEIGLNMQDCTSPRYEEVQWRAKQESRLRFGDDPGLVLGQPLFNSHQRLILIGAEPLDLALPQATPPQTDNIGSSQAALIVLYADTLEPVCKIPSENAIVELKWLRPDAMLLVGSGSMLHLVDCTTQENVQDWFASTALVADYGRGTLIRDFTFNRHNGLMLTGGQDGLCRLSAFADGSVLAPMREIALGGTISSVRWRPSSAVSESGAGSDCCSVTLESGGFELLDARKADPHVFRYIQPERLYTHAYDEPNDYHVMLAGAKGRITVLDLRKPTTACKQMVIEDPELSDIGSLSKSPLGQAVWCVAGTPGFSMWDLSATSTLLWHEHLLHHDITHPPSPSLTYAAFSDYGDLAVTTSTGHVAVFDEQMLRREHLGTIAASTSHELQQAPCEPNLPTPIVTVHEGFRGENARPPRRSRKKARR